MKYLSLASNQQYNLFNLVGESYMVIFGLVTVCKSQTTPTILHDEECFSPEL